MLRLLCLILGLHAAFLGLEQAGFVQRLSQYLEEQRIALVTRPASGEIVVVAIDTASLASAPGWPWPRSRHAALLDRLREAGVERVAIDIDFSSPSTPEQDRALAEALARWGNERVALPVFHDSDLGVAGSAMLTRPLPDLAAHVALTAVNVSPDGDGRVRSMAGRQQIAGTSFPAMPAWLVGAEIDGLVQADFTIDAATIPRLSYARVLDDPAVLPGLRGRLVLIGATAVSLGDSAPVPGELAMPGVVIQALLAESMLQGRALRAAPLPHPVGLALLATMVVLGRIVGVAWITAVIAGAGLAVEGLALGAASSGLAVPTAGPLLSLLLGGLGAILLRLGAIDRLREAAARALRRERALMERVVDASAEAILTVQADGRVVTANPAARRMFGAVDGSLADLEVSRLLAVPAGSFWSLAIAARPPFETTGRRGDGSGFAAEVSLSAITDGGPPQAVVVVRDIAERRAELARIAYLARHDQLTGLLNRAAFLEELTTPGVARGALVVLRFDGLAEIVQTLGVDAADGLVGQLAGWLRRRIGDDVPLARIADDSLAWYMPGLAPDEAEALVGRLIKDAPARLELGDDMAECHLRAGLASAPDHGTEPPALLRRAQAAAGQCRPPQAVLVYDAEQDRSLRRRLEILAALREAIATGAGLSVVYQPKIRLRDRCRVGAEALVRWEHASLGRVGPDEFIPLAEDAGLIGGLTDRILDLVLDDLTAPGEWQPGGPVAVNLSAHSLAEPGLAERLGARIAARGLPSSRLAFEVTESAMLSDVGGSARLLAALRDRGFKVAIDDFGAGNSSLGYLRDLPADELKLDRHFIGGALHGGAAAAIVTAIVELGHKLGLTVVIEGVEREEQAAWLTAVGADIAQGFLFGRPAPLERPPAAPAGRRRSTEYETDSLVPV